MSAFNVTSILTGTGYSSSNYSSWGGFGLVILFIVMFIGGCAGSTTGGIKIFRLQILFGSARSQIKKLNQPHGVFLNSFNRLKSKFNFFFSPICEYLAS